MKNLSPAALAACLALAGTAHAQESGRYTKAEVEARVVGNDVNWVRTRDGAKITYAFKSNGTVFYLTSNTRRNIPIAGTYTVSDSGTVCFKWNEDKYVAMQDGCVAFARDGTKTQIVSANDATRVFGEVAE